MPGTVDVTVVEFRGVSSSSKPSAKSLKVSMGKRQYQTWDKGNFSFPITKIKEKLVVALLDAGGNEIAHQDIGIMQIIEKGSLDEVFSINGCGHVHMKLRFTLSEEDCNRVRVVRETVIKKKLETNPNIKLLTFPKAITATPTSSSVQTSMKDEGRISASAKGSVNIDLTSAKVEASQAGLSPPSAPSSAISPATHQIDSAIPDATDAVGREPKVESPQLPDERTETPRIRPESEEVPSSKLPRSTILENNSLVASKTPQKQGTVDKTPSSVRKMITAFESSKLQEVKSIRRAASVPSQLYRLRKDGLLEDRPAESIVSLADKSSIGSKDHGVRNLDQLPTTVSGRAGQVCEPSKTEKELPSTVTPTWSELTETYAEDVSRASSRKEISKEGEKSTVDLMRKLASETANSSGRMTEERSQVLEPYEPSSRLLKSSESPAAEGSGRGRGTGLESLTMTNIDPASKPKPKTLQNYKEECHSAQSSGMWIFPDNTRRLCITTAGKQVTERVGHHHNEAKRTSLEMHKNRVHKKEHRMENNLKKIHGQPESGSAGSPNDSSNGLIGQVLKVAVIVGFGVLVLLTRQKEPRKKHKEEKDNPFHIPDYVDDSTMKPRRGRQ